MLLCTVTSRKRDLYEPIPQTMLSNGGTTGLQSYFKGNLRVTLELIL